MWNSGERGGVFSKDFLQMWTKIYNVHFFGTLLLNLSEKVAGNCDI